MKYGLRVIKKTTDPVVIKNYEATGWIESDRGVERWGQPHDIFTDINQAYKHLPPSSGGGTLYWLVEEVKD